MYTRCTECEVKESILESFSNPNGNLRVVIGTIAFGMGLDSPNVRHIIHWGPSSNIDSYIQEVGRCGRMATFHRQCSTMHLLIIPFGHKML